MTQKLLLAFIMLPLMILSSGQLLAKGHERSKWVDVSKDTNYFDRHCDYKVWVLEDGEWTETWYLEAFDAENAFYTINPQSTNWNNQTSFYALNYKDKTKFLIGENYIDVTTFSLCLNK